jgi:hypothetical protein
MPRIVIGIMSDTILIHTRGGIVHPKHLLNEGAEGDGKSEE